MRFEDQEKLRLEREQIRKEFLAGEPVEVRNAGLEVLDRMHGCPDANCHACCNNRHAIINLIAAARR